MKEIIEDIRKLGIEKDWFLKGFDVHDAIYASAGNIIINMMLIDHKDKDVGVKVSIMLLESICYHLGNKLGKSVYDVCFKMIDGDMFKQHLFDGSHNTFRRPRR